MATRHLFDVPDELLQRVPEVAAKLREEIDAFRDWANTDPEVPYGDVPGCDYVFGALLVPVVTEWGHKRGDPIAESGLARLFAYLEELLIDPNPNVAVMVRESFVETAVSEPKALEVLLESGGPALRRQAELVQSGH